ncbi:hypothetical protein [Coraliomargarita parva]|uniref:hypothetical protein n=1 Tax=Coraliomargarita parva TaxID=3014050 RepID=UPI0022B42B23|nr:hypothetical protein [Coraliomargarita parva]
MSAQQFCLVFLCLLSGMPVARAQSDSWLHGGSCVIKVDGRAGLQSVGTARVQLADAALPYYYPGVFDLRAEAVSTVYAKTSNGMRFAWSGPGYFAFERFEQMASGAGDPPGLSRMILNLRSGRLVLDSRSLPVGSQLIFEVPVGRITLRSALWLIEIRYDERSRIYTFQMECKEGSLRYTDRRGQDYLLRDGQRLAGAGPASSPGIEISTITAEAVERFGDVALVFDQAEDLAAQVGDFAAVMSPLSRSVNESTYTAAESAASVDSEARPIVIEFAPRTAPLYPYRGVIRPPSDYETDLF